MSDYYDILGINDNATEEDIKNAYKKLATKWHPDKHKKKKDKDLAEKRFTEITNAYKVLSDPDKRVAYDVYGDDNTNSLDNLSDLDNISDLDDYDDLEDEMKDLDDYEPYNGNPFRNNANSSTNTNTNTNTNTSSSTNTQNSQDASNDIFNKYFANNEFFRKNCGWVFDQMNGVNDNYNNNHNNNNHNNNNAYKDNAYNASYKKNNRSYNIKKSKKKMKTGPTVSYDLNCSLEDLYYGKTKKFRIKRKIYDGSAQKTELKQLEIKIEPGWKTGTSVTFEKFGDIYPDTIPGDIIFVVREVTHNIYKRFGDDLIIDCPISLYEALNGFTRTLNTLDGKTEIIKMGHLSSTLQTHIIPNGGMPIRKQKKVIGYGNLTIKFYVTLNDISDNKKKAISSLLKN